MIDIEKLSESIIKTIGGATRIKTAEDVQIATLTAIAEQLKRIADSSEEIQGALISTNDKDGRKGVKLLFEQDALAGLCRMFFDQIIDALDSATKFGQKNKKGPTND